MKPKEKRRGSRDKYNAYMARYMREYRARMKINPRKEDDEASKTTSKAREAKGAAKADEAV